MGTPIPEPLEDDKFYCITVRAHQGYMGDCTDPYVVAKCCREGWYINDWGDFGAECQNWWELCIVSGYTAQEVLSIAGPFDTLEECAGSCI